jgi:putative lipoic acid-binding regulatory protein
MDFPSIFPLKVMGANEDDFEALVISIIGKHASVATEKAVSRRLSRGGRFLSLTVHIQAENQAQLDAIYRELSAHERVLMML